MSTNLADLNWDEDVTAVVRFVNSVGGETAFEADSMQILEHGVMVRRTFTTGVAPDPVTTNQFTWFIPWENVAGITQGKAL